MGDSGGIAPLVDELANVLTAMEVDRRRREDLQTGLMAVDIFVIARCRVLNLAMRCDGDCGQQCRYKDNLATSLGLKWTQDHDLIDMSASSSSPLL